MSEPPSSPVDSRLERDFIELATRPLEDTPEARDEARGELMGRLMQERLPDQEAKVEAALSRLAKQQPGSWRWKGVLASVALLLTLAILAAFRILVTLPEIQLAPIVLAKRSPQAWFNRLPERDRDFISAGNSKTFYFPLRRPQWEVLADLELYRKAFPDDPAVYECYALQYVEASNTLPPDYNEVWQRLDPDNGIWNLWAAGAKMIRPPGTTSYPPGTVEEAMRLLGAALSAPRLDTRMPELQVRRMEKFPKLPATYLGNAMLLQLAEPVKENRGETILSASMISALIHYEGMECWQTRDQERLKSLIAAWRQVASHLFLECSNYENFNSKLYLLIMGASLQSHAGSLNLGAEQKQMAQLMNRIDSLTPISVKRTGSGGHYGLTRNHPGLVQTEGASTLARRRAERSRIEDPPEAYVPGRRSEIAAVDRFLAMAAAILLLPVVTLAWFESWRRGRRVNGLADGLRPLFSWADTAWTIALGGILPLLWYWGITRLTSLGLHDFELSQRRPYLAQALQGLSCLLLSLALMLQVARWRLGRKLGFLNLTPRHPWLGWAVVAVTALLLPALGALRWISSAGGPEIFYGFIAACGIPVLWLLWQAGALFFSPGSTALGGVLQSRLLIAPLATACMLMIGIQLPLKSSEQHWLSLDEVTRCDLSRGGIPPAEARKVAELARQLAAVLRDEN